MAQIGPESTVETVNGGLPLVDVVNEGIYLCIGPAADGPTGANSARLLGYEQIVSTYKAGPLAKDAAYTAGRNNTQVLCIRRTPTARAASYETDLAAWTGTSSVTPSGASPERGMYLVLEFTVSATVGIAGGMYRWSDDGGETFGAPVALGTALFITYRGVTVTFDSGDTVDGTAVIRAFAPSAAIVGMVQTVDGSSGTLTLVADGSPNPTAPIDAYEILFEVLSDGEGGVGGTDAIRARYSLDNGRNYSDPISFGTAVEMSLLDGETPIGVKAVIQSGQTYLAGDQVTALTTAPELQASDIASAIEIATAGPYSAAYTLVHPCSNLGSASNVTAIQAALDAVRLKYPLRAFLDCRDRLAGEPMVEYETWLATQAQNNAADRIAIGGGFARITDLITNVRLRRCVSWRGIEWLINQPLRAEMGDWSAGAVPDVDIYDIGGQTVVEHDRRVSNTLHDARYVTVTTRDRVQGVYFTRGNMMAATNSDIQVMAYGRLLDLAQVTLQVTAENILGITMFPDPLTGLLSEADAQRFDSIYSRALEEAILVGQAGDNGGAVAVQARVNRTQPLTKPIASLDAEVRIVGVAYLGKFTGRIGFARRLPQ